MTAREGGLASPSRRTRAGWGYALLVGAGALAPFAVYPVFLMHVLCLALFASAFDLLLGYTGLLSFGHAAFWGASAYVTSEAIKVWGMPVEAAVATGTGLAALLGAIFGALAIRRSGIYFAMITLGFAQMVYVLVLEMPWTGGEDGLQAVPAGRLLGVVSLHGTLALYYFVFVMFLGAFWLVNRAVRSPFGQVLRAIRENPARVLALGYDVGRFKLVAFVLSAAISGFAGALKAVVFQSATLSDVHWHRSGEVVLMTLLGGMGTPLGPVAGALLVAALDNYLAEYGSWVTAISGAVFVACVLTFRRGLVGELAALIEARSRRRS